MSDEQPLGITEWATVEKLERILGEKRAQKAELDEARASYCQAMAENRALAARLRVAREALERIGHATTFTVALRMARAALSPPSPDTREPTGMQPGQRCTIPEPHQDPHEFNPSAARTWVRYGDENRCPYIEPGGTR